MMSSEDMDIQPNTDNPGLFDVSIAAIIDPYDVIQENMISCEVTIPNTDFKIIAPCHSRTRYPLKRRVFRGAPSDHRVRAHTT